MYFTEVRSPVWKRSRMSYYTQSFLSYLSLWYHPWWDTTNFQVTTACPHMQPILEALYKDLRGVHRTYYLMPAWHQTLFGSNIAWLSNILFACFKRPLGKCLSFTFRSMSCFNVQLSFSIAFFPQKFFIFWQAALDSHTEVFLLQHINNLPGCKTDQRLSHGLHSEERTATIKNEVWHKSFASWISTESGSQGSSLPSQVCGF